MNYKIEFSKKAAKFFNTQPPQQQKRLAKAISKLPEGDVKLLKGYSSNIYRLKVGDYRIIFTINHEKSLIQILIIGNRGDIYKNCKKNIKNKRRELIKFLPFYFF